LPHQMLIIGNVRVRVRDYPLELLALKLGDPFRRPLLRTPQLSFDSQCRAPAHHL
jgi:hypothetical protein